jgi:hypothetical protein
MPGTFQGSSDVIEQPSRRDYSKSNGWATIRSWVGPRDAIYDFAVELTSTGAESLSITDEGPTSTVTATYPDAQDSSIDSTQGIDNVEWELLGSDLEKPLETHSALNPGTDATKIDDITAAKAAAINGNPLDAAWGTAAQQLYQLMSQGVQAYVTTQYVLRKTIKVARGSEVQASLSNVNRVEAPSGVPTDLFNVPTSTGDGSTLEWLKKPPTVRALGKGKFAIEQEWWGATKWSSGLYGGTSSP